MASAIGNNISQLISAPIPFIGIPNKPTTPKKIIVIKNGVKNRQIVAKIKPMTNPDYEIKKDFLYQTYFDINLAAI